MPCFQRPKSSPTFQGPKHRDGRLSTRLNPRIGQDCAFVELCTKFKTHLRQAHVLLSKVNYISVRTWPNSSHTCCIPQSILICQSPCIPEQELVQVFSIHRDVRQIRHDVICLPTRTREEEIREACCRVHWKFCTREVGQHCARAEW